MRSLRIKPGVPLSDVAVSSDIFPSDEIMKMSPSQGRPAGEGCSLTRNAEPRDVPSLEAGTADGLPDDLADSLPELIRVQLVPPGAGDSHLGLPGVNIAALATVCAC